MALLQRPFIKTTGTPPPAGVGLRGIRPAAGRARGRKARVRGSDPALAGAGIRGALHARRDPSRKRGGGVTTLLRGHDDITAQSARTEPAKGPLFRTVEVAERKIDPPSPIPPAPEGLWRTRHDSNVWPPPSEGGALSS